MAEFHERLRRIRRRLGWSQAQMAKALKVSGSTLAHWEQEFAMPRESALEGELGERIAELEVEAKAARRRERERVQREEAEKLAQEQAIEQGREPSES